MSITPAQLADALHFALHAGRFGEAVEKYLRGILNEWEAQQARSSTLEADDTDYAALVKEQLRIEQAINTARQERNFQRLFGAQGGDTDTGNTSHDASIIG